MPSERLDTWRGYDTQTRTVCNITNTAVYTTDRGIIIFKLIDRRGIVTGGSTSCNHDDSFNICLDKHAGLKKRTFKYLFPRVVNPES